MAARINGPQQRGDGEGYARERRGQLCLAASRCQWIVLLCRLCVALQRRTGTDEVTVAIDVVHAVHGWPVFVDPEGTRREAGSLAAVGAAPFAHQIFHRVRSKLQRIILGVKRSVGDRLGFGRDAEHGADEAVKLRLRFALGRFHHQRPGHGPAHRRGMEAAIDQALRDIVHGDAGLVLHQAGVEDALMCNAALGGIEDGIGGLESASDVVGVEDRDLGRLGEAFGTHQQAIGPAD